MLNIMIHHLITLALWYPGGVPEVAAFPDIGAATHMHFTIEVSNVKDDAGMMIVAVYDESRTFLTDNILKRLSVQVSGLGVLQIQDVDLSAGEYAIAVFHDVDGDGVLDKNWLGIPNEPIGFSNDARGRMGPPKYTDALFSLSRQHQTIRITLY